jgi:transposase
MGQRNATAPHRIVLVRLRWHQPTRAYAARRTAQGRTSREIMRCLKRYIPREVFALLRETGTQQSQHPTTA